jgi:branched-chain amino acid transport system permease protein
MDFLYSYIVLAEIYVLLGLSTNLLVGIVGIFSVSQAAVFGVGAYVVAHFLMASDALPFIPALAIAAACCVALPRARRACRPRERYGEKSLLR